MDWREEYRSALLDISINPPDIRKIVKPHIPDKLYKYGNFESQYWEDTIYKAQIYLAPAKSFNDPFDCRANFDYKKAISKGKFRDELIIRFGENDVENLAEEMIEKVIEGMREDVFVSCFSEVWNSILMWAHYARSYSGFCIEYDMKQVREHILYNLYPTLYEKEYIDITDNLINYNKNTGLICTLAKALEWGYEKEWRIVEFTKRPFYFRKALKAVYLGENCSSKIKKQILQWAKDNKKMVYFVYASNVQYELEAKREI